VRACRLVLAAVMLAAPSRLAAQEPWPSGTVVEGTLSFDGKGTGGAFVGTTRTVSGTMTGAAALADVRGHVEAPVSTLDTDNDRRDRDLNKSMESDKFPVIRFDLERVQVKSESPSGAEVTLGGRLTLHGVTKEVELPAIVERDGGRARVRTDFPVNLREYQVKGLSKMLGILKMHEDIVVHVDVTFGS
jgi:polyisoprenoid-binding protein YceI